MPVPWLQLIQWVPSIVDLSRDLLRKSREPEARGANPTETLQVRIAALEENERRQAELVASMAQQSAALSEAVTALHRQLRVSQIITTVAVMVAIAVSIVAALK